MLKDEKKFWAIGKIIVNSDNITTIRFEDEQHVVHVWFVNGSTEVCHFTDEEEFNKFKRIVGGATKVGGFFNK